MKTRYQQLIFFFCIIAASLSGEVQESIIPLMDNPPISQYKKKMNRDQQHQLNLLLSDNPYKLRVISFNMLFNLSWAEKDLAAENHWVNRFSRVVELIRHIRPDIIGSQELQQDQIDDLMNELGDDYAYYGVGREDGEAKGEIETIFYRKDRIQLIRERILFLNEKGHSPGPNPYGKRNAVTICHFRDLRSHNDFYVLNIHTAFSNMESRLYEVQKVAKFVEEKLNNQPVIVTGDFNTFPFRGELDLPFYDGEQVNGVMTGGCLKDSQFVAALGHVGPISSTNYSEKEKKSFVSQGTPGVILDHIYVNSGIRVLMHGIEPAKVNGHYPSDHFPVVVDLVVDPICHILPYPYPEIMDGCYH